MLKTSHFSANLNLFLGATEDDPNTQLDIRSRLNNLAFIFSLPHLVMLSNLRKLIGIRTGKKIFICSKKAKWITILTVIFGS